MSLNNNEIKLMMAPLQGYTEVEYRRAYGEVYGVDAVDLCFTPFIRIEHGEPLAKSVRDVMSPLNDGAPVTRPQIICKDADEFDKLRAMLVANGLRQIDINAGCPHKPQVNRGRGAGMLTDKKRFAGIMERVRNDSECRYTLKMRLGVEDPDEWMPLIDIINDTPLEFVTVHPRTARQQYGGCVDMNAFKRLADALHHPVVYNGDIHTPEDIERITRGCSRLIGVMMGRGLLARPSLPLEWRTGCEWTESERLDKIMQLYRRFEALLIPRLCGDSQMLAKLRPFWHYLEQEIGRKSLKRIDKAGNMAAYADAVSGILKR